MLAEDVEKQETVNFIIILYTAMGWHRHSAKSKRIKANLTDKIKALQLCFGFNNRSVSEVLKQYNDQMRKQQLKGTHICMLKGIQMYESCTVKAFRC